MANAELDDGRPGRYVQQPDCQPEDDRPISNFADRPGAVHYARSMKELRLTLNLDFDSEPRHYTEQIKALMRWLAYGCPASILVICLIAVAVKPSTRIVVASAVSLVGSVWYSLFLFARASGRDALFLYARVSADSTVSIYNLMDWIVIGVAIAFPTSAIYLFFIR
jgi:hypothetical protein